MRVPHGRKGFAARRWGRGIGTAAVAVALLASVSLAAASDHNRKQVPSYQLSLEALGYSGASATFLNSGSSMLTVHYLDDSHLLLTYSLRKLVPRVAGDPQTDEDRLVAAEVVELPSGKIEAHTEWHMHDHARYLWSLGRGRFIVRIGTGLYSFAPLANLGAKEPFALHPFPNRGPGLVAILVSPDSELVTIETVKPTQQPEVTVGDLATVSDTHTLIDFYRISGEGSAVSPLVVANAGSMLTTKPVLLPLDADGYLWASPAGRGRYAMSFDSFAGKHVDLGPLESSCDPRLQMVSHSEFLAMTCHGMDTDVHVASFGLDGHETWEEALGDFGAPTFAYAPAAARFAVSHVVTTASAPVVPSQFGLPPTGPPPEETSRQEIRVYQIASGDLLLKADSSPVMKSAENFDLAPDGLQLVMVRDGQLVFYKLTPLTKQDREDMAEVAKFAPASSSGPVTLGRIVRENRHDDAPAVVASGPQGDSSGSAPAMTVGDEPAVGAPRKPPTLLNPGEKAEMPGAQAQPN